MSKGSFLVVTLAHTVGQELPPTSQGDQTAWLGAVVYLPCQEVVSTPQMTLEFADSR